MDKKIRERYGRPKLPEKKPNTHQSIDRMRSLRTSALREHLSHEISAKEMRLRRSSTLHELPSHKLSASRLSRDLSVSSAMKRRMTSIEVLKLRRQSSICRQRIMSENVEDVLKLLISQKETLGHNPEGELKQINASLHVRKQIKYAYDIHKMLDEERRIPLYTVIFSCLKTFFSHARDVWMRITQFFDIWRKPIKYIYGHFGTEVASYFVFARYLILLNLLNVFIILVFIFIPQAYSDIKYGFDNNGSVSFNVRDLFTGSGSFSKTLLYYGHYTNETFVDSTGRQYYFPLAYVLSIIFLLIINLLFLAYSLSVEYRKSAYMLPSSKTKFSSKVLASWDCHIETEIAAALKKENIYFELMDLLNAEHREAIGKKQKPSLLEILGCILINVVTLALIYGFAYVVHDQLTHFKYWEKVSFFQALLLPFLISIAVFVFHYVLKYLSVHEFYLSKENRVHFITLRICFFRLSVLGVLVYFWFTGSFSGKREQMCIEQYKGEEVYRLMLMNFVFDTVIFLGILFLWLLFDKFLLSSVFEDKLPEFNVPFHINDLIYYQTLVWIGLFTIPLTPLMALLILSLNFYAMKYGIKNCFKPSRGIASARLSHTVHLLILFTCFLLVLVVASYFLFFSKPSSMCGPFRNYKYPYEVVSNWISSIIMRSVSFGTFLNIFRTPSFIITGILLLLVSMYFSRAHAIGYRKTVDYLEEQLIQEGKDKVFLLEIYENMLR